MIVDFKKVSKHAKRANSGLMGIVPDTGYSMGNSARARRLNLFRIIVGIAIFASVVIAVGSLVYTIFSRASSPAESAQREAPAPTASDVEVIIRTK